MAAQVKQLSPPRGSRFIQHVGSLGIDLRWVMAAVALLFLASLGAFTQDLRPDPFRVPAPLSLAWWRYPIELRAYKRWPIVTGDIHGLAVTGEPRRVWAVGEGGLILSSDDDGESWAQHQIALAEDVQPLPGTGLPGPVVTAGAKGSGELAGSPDAPGSADRKRLSDLDRQLATLVPDDRMRTELVSAPADLQAKLVYALGKVDPARVQQLLQERAALLAKLAPVQQPQQQQAGAVALPDGTGTDRASISLDEIDRLRGCEALDFELEPMRSGGALWPAVAGAVVVRSVGSSRLGPSCNLTAAR